VGFDSGQDLVVLVPHNLASRKPFCRQTGERLSVPLYQIAMGVFSIAIALELVE
jgi:hypothetical protein